MADMEGKGWCIVIRGGRWIVIRSQGLAFKAKSFMLFFRCMPSCARPHGIPISSACSNDGSVSSQHVLSYHILPSYQDRIDPTFISHIRHVPSSRLLDIHLIKLRRRKQHFCRCRTPFTIPTIIPITPPTTLLIFTPPPLPFPRPIPLIQRRMTHNPARRAMKRSFRTSTC
jgi:hypothetical protein